YGSNASGKSNLLAAMGWFREFVRWSSKETQAGESIEVNPFLLSSETENAPTFFEVEFFLNDFEYRYGFEVSRDKIESEWLFRKSTTAKAARLFTRQGQSIDVSHNFFKEGKGLESR